MYQTGQSRRIDGTFLPNWVKASTLGIPNPVLVMIIVFLVFLFVLNRTRYGRGIYAIGGNKQTAYLAGIPVKRYLILTYALGVLEWEQQQLVMDMKWMQSLQLLLVVHL